MNENFFLGQVEERYS